MIIKNNFHKKGFALGLVLKQRLAASCKCLITRCLKGFTLMSSNWRLSYMMSSFLGSFDIVHVKDNTGHQFATRISNIFIIGKTNKPHVSLPKGKGVRLTIAEERDRRLQEKAKMSSM